MSCEACGKRAVSTGHDSVYRYVPKSLKKGALFCKNCASRVHAFVNRMIETGGKIDFN